MIGNSAMLLCAKMVRVKLLVSKTPGKPKISRRLAVQTKEAFWSFHHLGGDDVSPMTSRVSRISCGKKAS